MARGRKPGTPGAVTTSPRSTVARLRAAVPGDVLWFAEGSRRIFSDARRIGMSNRVKVSRWLAVHPASRAIVEITRAEVSR